jgi:NhaP-type Na+/H+ or K+/H+ antiporter
MTDTLRRIPARLVLVGVVLAGWLAAHLLGLRDVDRSPVYLYATSLLLALGLFGSTYGIDRSAARHNRRVIVAAVTVGVLLKAALIIGLAWLVTGNPVFIVLGVAVAQIDPLSVASIMGDDRMSPRAKSILASWASFDDPVTVILAVYASAVAAGTFGLGRDGSDYHGVAVGVAGYGVDLALNLALAALAYLAWRTLRHRPILLATVLIGLAAVAVWQFLMLAVAIAGLFVRPAGLDALIGRLTRYALLAAGALLGLLLVNGISLGYGVLLGVLAFASQLLVAPLLTRGLPRADRVHLALAQQNGITAIILSLRLESQFPATIAVIAPAIVVTNTIYWAANRVPGNQIRSGPVNEPGPSDGSTPLGPEPQDLPEHMNRVEPEERLELQEHPERKAGG